MSRSRQRPAAAQTKGRGAQARRTVGGDRVALGGVGAEGVEDTISEVRGAGVHRHRVASSSTAVTRD